ncbi:MAG: D-glycero-alpha-D-manno-heptose-7-phosphate kinase [Acetobacteraceae bacterium]|jgi:D-glycero-alpha-D-manno-heptose-7-phosphate kinase|nr:D-glycero-alpha-D-manno-heptose-7-phosphate kinase [Acetobacteraceae bacterium]MEA2769013.1 D-glycero-alpha-D-manno-heptose-7-phosphate kinase [Acetobacteraceae bacterium]
MNDLSMAEQPHLSEAVEYGWDRPARTHWQSPKVVMTRTPLRISFAGGGTDLPDFYQLDDGAVLSTAVDKYVYVTVKRHSEIFNEPIRLNYSRTEQVNTIGEIENNIARECLKFLQIEPPIFISTVADMPASTGLGGSSSFAVGLLNALHAFRGERVSAGQLAEEACHIEIDVLKEPIGKQDQYAAAFGGLNLLRFCRDGRVTVEPQHVVNGSVARLFSNIMMFWTGHQRAAASVLTEQKAETPRKLDVLQQMRDQAYDLRGLFAQPEIDLARVGGTLHQGWELKRRLGSKITNPEIDWYYGRAMDAGAEGGRLCGAGGGGFLMFLVKPDKREPVRRSLADLKFVPIGYEMHGSKVLYPMG